MNRIFVNLLNININEFILNLNKWKIIKIPINRTNCQKSLTSSTCLSNLTGRREKSTTIPWTMLISVKKAFQRKVSKAHRTTQPHKAKKKQPMANINRKYNLQDNCNEFQIFLSNNNCCLKLPFNKESEISNILSWNYATMLTTLI